MGVFITLEPATAPVRKPGSGRPSPSLAASTRDCKFSPSKVYWPARRSTCRTSTSSVESRSRRFGLSSRPPRPSPGKAKTPNCSKRFAGAVRLRSVRGVPWADAFPPWKERFFPWKEAVSPWKDAVFPWKESFPPWKEAVFPWKENVPPWKEALFPWKESVSPWKAGVWP